MTTPESSHETALDARSNDFAAIPGWSLTKEPIERWKRWPKGLPPTELLCARFTDINVSADMMIFATTIAMFNCESLDMAKLVAEASDTLLKMRTPGDVHLGNRRHKDVAMKYLVPVKTSSIHIRIDHCIESIALRSFGLGAEPARPIIDVFGLAGERIWSERKRRTRSPTV